VARSIAAFAEQHIDVIFLIVVIAHLHHRQEEEEDTSHDVVSRAGRSATDCVEAMTRASEQDDVRRLESRQPREARAHRATVVIQHLQHR
jgi:hypothetical protein